MGTPFTVHFDITIRGSDLFLPGYLDESEADKIVDFLRMYEHCENFYNQEYFHNKGLQRITYKQALEDLIEYFEEHHRGMVRDMTEPWEELDDETNELITKDATKSAVQLVRAINAVKMELRSL